MQRLGLALFFALFVISCAKVHSVSKKEKLGNLNLWEGSRLLAEGKYPRAIRHLRASIKYVPQSYEAWGHLGIAYFHREKYRMAEKAFQQAIAINPKHGDAKNNLGLMYAKLGKSKEAERVFRENLENLEYEDQALTYYNLGNLYMARKRFLKARYFFQKSTKENPNYCQSWFRLSEVATHLKDNKAKELSLKKASSGLCYRFAQAHYQLGQFFLRQRRYESAKEKFSEIVEHFSMTAWADRAKEQLETIPN